MRAKDFIDYLQKFPGDSNVCFLLADVSARTLYHAKDMIGITDSPEPTICIDLGDPEPFTYEMEKAAEEDEHENKGD